MVLTQSLKHGSILHDFLCALPKCEHHIHIEGTLDPELLFTLAERNSVQLPLDDPAFESSTALKARYSVFENLDDFLHYYFIGFSVLLTEADFEALTYAYLERAHAQNVHHLEVFFDPQVHMERGISYSTVMSGLSAAKARAAAELPDLSVMFIPCLVRHLPIPSALNMLAEVVAAGHFEDGTVAGFGMSSTEKNMHPTMFTSVYDSAREAGVRNLTAHFGEEGPAEYVSSAITHLGVGRIDHGRRAAEDPALLDHLAKNSIMLTLCPISNVALRGIAEIEQLPIREFLERGVRFSLNSDDPAYFGGHVLDCYCAVQDAFNLSVGEWETIAKGAIDGSWCSSERKQQLSLKVDEAVRRQRMMIPM
ncbi:adenosine deaminase [Stachybotrys elegans]|uniref:Adenine deaminase n=1 Tax=Stachybotrys elegans TaxID=80388 RepID=A0A8K0SKV2_9HYPO|nr:adenosine deaminase [Stachybotrys elegans]